ncbi:MAG: hypothetical protein WCC36_00410 [Gammaproteobacteria bacterium]
MLFIFVASRNSAKAALAGGAVEPHQFADENAQRPVGVDALIVLVARTHAAGFKQHIVELLQVHGRDRAIALDALDGQLVLVTPDVRLDLLAVLGQS